VNLLFRKKECACPYLWRECKTSNHLFTDEARTADKLPGGRFARALHVIPFIENETKARAVF